MKTEQSKSQQQPAPPVRVQPLVSVTVEIPKHILESALSEMSIRIQVVECGMDIATPLDKIAFAVLAAYRVSHANDRTELPEAK